MTKTLVATPDPEPHPRNGGYVQYPGGYASPAQQEWWREGMHELAQIIADVEAGRTEAVWQ